MAGICFYFEESDVDVWSGKNLDAWNYAAKAAGDIDKMIVINRTSQEIKTPDADLDFKVVSELPELENSVKICCPWKGGISLWEYDHSADWYIFGPSEGWDSGDVHIPTAGRGALHSVHAATVVMCHRYQSWQ